MAYLAVVTIPLVVSDLRFHRLPNAWVVPGYAVVLVAWVGQWVSTGVFPWVSVISGGAYFAFLFLLAWFGGMGMGDVKLAGVVGAAAGLLAAETTVLCVVLAFVCGGVVSLGVLVTDRVRRTPQSVNSPEKSRSQRRIAFGPFILLAFWVAAGLHVLA
jgi:leader peptidase (prepilin peptidase)/N-methyltransferase